MLGPGGVVFIHTLYHFFLLVDVSYFLLMMFYMWFFYEWIGYLVLRQVNWFSWFDPLDLAPWGQRGEHHHLFELLLIFLFFNQLLEFSLVLLLLLGLLVELFPQYLMWTFNVFLDKPVMVLLLFKQNLLCLLLFQLLQLYIVSRHVQSVLRLHHLLLFEFVDCQVFSPYKWSVIVQLLHPLSVLALIFSNHLILEILAPDPLILLPLEFLGFKLSLVQ